MLIGLFFHPEFLVITMLSILPSLYRQTKTFAFHHQRAPPTPFLYYGHIRPPFNSLRGWKYRSVLELKHKIAFKKNWESKNAGYQ